MNANRFTRRLATAVVVAFGLAASAAYASPPDPVPQALDSGQQLNTELIVQDTGQAIASAVITEKIAAVDIARIKELDTSPQHETVPAAYLVVTPAANIDANYANAEPVPIDTSPQPSNVPVATIVNSARLGIGTIAYAPQELDTSPPVTRTASQLIGALGIDAHFDTGQLATFAGYQVLALSA